MLVTLAFYPGDQDQALRLSSWILELGGAKGHSLLLVRDKEVSGDEKLQENFRQAFSEVNVIEPLPDAYHSWPQSANAIFAFAARHVQNVLGAPYFLFLEPDAIPLREGWLDALQGEYEVSGKPFMGADVNVAGVPRHMSGVGVYNGKLTHTAGLALIAHEEAWDCVAASQIVPQAHFTNLIAHSWDRDTAAKLRNRKERFETWEAVENEVLIPHPGVVLYHGDKSGSLIRRLQEQKPSFGCPAPKSVIQVPDKMVELGSGIHAGQTPVDTEESKVGGAVPTPEKTSNQSKTPGSTAPPSFSCSDELAAKIASTKASKPWANKEESKREIALYAQALGLFCTAPRYTKFVRDSLREAGVIK